MFDLYNVMPKEMKLFGHVFEEARTFSSNDAVTTGWPSSVAFAVWNWS